MATLPERLRAYQDGVAQCRICHDAHLLYLHPDGRPAYPVQQRNPTGKARVLVVAEAPNATDTFDLDKGYLTYGPGSDATGIFETELLGEIAGLNLADVLFTNAVLCLPARRNDRHPVTARLRKSCSPNLKHLVQTAAPLVVVTFGTQALHALKQIETHDLQLKTAAGTMRPWFGRHLLPLYHPSRLARITRSEDRQRKDIAPLAEFLKRQR
jgi:uracil-DNA glycosylase family 4